MPTPRAALPFVKMQATGNHFVVVDALDGRRGDWPALAQRVCGHRVSVGADGLLVVTRPRSHGESAGDAPVARMRMYNPDGSEDMCGNGTRCVAAYLRARGHAGGKRFRIETLSGIHTALTARRTGGRWLVEVSLGRPSLCSRDIPVAAELDRVIDYPLEVARRTVPLTALSTGTAHAVVFTPDVSQIQELGPRIMSHPFFPRQASVSCARVESRTRVMARVWERGGVGESLSCGTGALAILVAAHLKGLADQTADIIFPGGTLRARWDDAGLLWLAGPAEFVYQGILR